VIAPEARADVHHRAPSCLLRLFEGSNEPSGRWWLLREGPNAFILRENGAKELYRMGTDPYQEQSEARTADPALIERLTNTVEYLRVASGATRRHLEEAL
jgi:hypothetical protein